MNESATQLDAVKIGERLKKARNSLGLSQKAFALKIGASTSGLQANEEGRSMPGAIVLGSFIKLGINSNWLLAEEGPMRLADVSTADGVDASDLHAYGECLEILEMALNKANKTLSPEKKRIAVDSMYLAWKRERKPDPQLLEMITKFAA